MPMPLDPERQHDWRRIRITPLRLKDGELYDDLNRPVDVKVGCFNCNMGFDEGKDVNCPGQDLFETEDEHVNNG